MILGSSFTLHTASDLVALVKPRVTFLVIATTACGLWLVPGSPSPSLAFLTLLGTVLLVGAANVLNMYLERDIDALMRRTMDRPLAARRLSPRVALGFGTALAVLAILVLSVWVNLLTALLGVIAFVIYVLFYTPLKQKSHAALLVGAIPGAMPPLMGWTAVTGSLSLPENLTGLNLFFILFLWQIPHFLAIALFRKEDYEKAGIRVLPLEKGDQAAKHTIVRYLAGLFAVSLYPVWYGLAGRFYLWTAVLLGAAFFIGGLYGLRLAAGSRWARSFFFGSIIYLPVLLGVLVTTSLN